MGTLHQQEPREWAHVRGDDAVADVIRLAGKFNLPVEQVTAILDMAERRRANDLAVMNGDIWDEQISGMGQLLDTLAAAVALRE